MDIKRLSLWEGRNATYMSNDSFSVIIEDQGEVALELSARMANGARISPLSLPYFRGTGSGVYSDENSTWWRSRQGLYQAGGAYFNFPENNEDVINSSNTYWMLRKYGTEDEHHGVWKYSEMKSRAIGNRFHLGRVDLLIPGHNVLYTAIRITNTGDEVLQGSPSWNAMLSSPLVESGSMISTNSKYFSVYPLRSREWGVNRFATGQVFEDLKKAPLEGGGIADASIVPPPTGTYDYMIGKFMEKEETRWVSVINPRSQMLFITFTPKMVNEDDYEFPNSTIGENYYGRVDSPWALFDGATPQVMAVTAGFNSGPKGTKNLSLKPGESKNIFIGSAFTHYINPRLSLGFYNNEVSEDGFVFKRTKSSVLIPADTAFKALRKLSKRVFFLGSDSIMR